MWGLIIGGCITAVAIGLRVEGRIDNTSFFILLGFALISGVAIAYYGSTKKVTAGPAGISLETFEKQADEIKQEKIDEIKAEVTEQKKQLSDVVTQANQTKEELERVAEMAAPPMLSLKSYRQVPTKEGEHRILLEFESTKKSAPFGTVVFHAEIIEGTDATIRGFMFPEGSGWTFGESKTSDDGKKATQEYIPIGSGVIILTLDVSAPCKVLLSCSHMKEPLELEIK